MFDDSHYKTTHHAAGTAANLRQAVCDQNGMISSWVC